MEKRKVEKIFQAKPTIEGAGVHLKRGFGYFEVPQFDPFLLFDDFTNERGDDSYTVGFPMHPHRGIETVTYILEGEVRHADSLGNAGNITAGDVQWMTAGSGIVHEEMPQRHKNGIRGFQLWVNLPKESKMMNPRYQEVKAVDIPIVEAKGTAVRVIAGAYKGTEGPVRDLMIEPTYLDVILPPGASFVFETSPTQNFFVYVFEGSLAIVDGHVTKRVTKNDVALLERGEHFTCTAERHGVRFLLIGGEPIGEPVAWGGPIVMNTEKELERAFEEYKAHTFVKK